MTISMISPIFSVAFGWTSAGAPQAVCVFKILFDIFPGDLAGGGALLVRSADDLVVNVRKVLYERDLVSLVGEIPAQHVENDHRAGVADMDQVIDRRPQMYIFTSPGTIGINSSFLPESVLYSFTITIPF